MDPGRFLYSSNPMRGLNREIHPCCSFKDIAPTCQMLWIVNWCAEKPCQIRGEMFYLTFLTAAATNDPALLSPISPMSKLEITRILPTNKGWEKISVVLNVCFARKAGRRSRAKTVSGWAWLGLACPTSPQSSWSAARWPRIRHHLLSWMKIKQEERISNECKIFVNISRKVLEAISGSMPHKYLSSRKNTYFLKTQILFSSIFDVGWR